MVENCIFIHCSHDGSMTIILDNKFHAHTQLERFNRIKNDSVPSYELIQYLKSLKVDFNLIYFSRLSDDSTLRMWYDAFWNWGIITKNTKLLYENNTNHHIYHKSCSTIFTKTPYVFISDGHGSIRDLGSICEIEQMNLYFNESRSWGRYVLRDKKNNLDKNHGLGHPYQVVASQIFNQSSFGNIRNNNLMALSDYGDSDEQAINLLDADKIVYEKLPPLNINEKNTQNACASIQEWFERENIKIFKKHEVREPMTLTGGCAQNVKANSRFIKEGFNIEVDPLCTDQGISLGLANKHLKLNLKFDNVYLGITPKYNINTLDPLNVKNVTLNEVVKILIDNPIGIFQGRSEQGQRGLGNRSLIANPFNNFSKEKINSIKKRSWYRPFACSVLEEDAKIYFKMIKQTSPYMLFTFEVKDEFKEKLKLVSSVRHTSRIQTVNQQQNKNLYNLLSLFKEKTGHGLVLNTSLNLPGVPLVENLNDVKYMMDNSNLKFVYLPDIEKIIINENLQ